MFHAIIVAAPEDAIENGCAKSNTTGAIIFGCVALVPSVVSAAEDGTIYVGYQQYLDSSLGCNAGVQNVLARSTDGGGTFTHTVLDIVQGGACPTG